MCAIPVNARDENASLAEILHAVHRNVDFLKENIINLINTEEITVEEFNDREKRTRAVNIISDYRVFPEKTGPISDCRVIYEILESMMPTGILREEREMLSVKENNRTQRLDRFEFTEPFWARGSSYVDLLILFDKQSEQCFDYELKGAGNADNRDVYIIGIRQKEADIGETAGEKNETISWNVRYRGVAFIDSATMEIVRLNRDMVNINYNTQRAKNSPLHDMFPSVALTRYGLLVQYEYGRVRINDKYLTLPVTKAVDLFRENGQQDASYKYRYGNYRAFTVDTKIIFGATDEPSVE